MDLTSFVESLKEYWRKWLHNTSIKVKARLPSLLVTNACHITNKVDELQGVVEINNADIAIVTDSWLTASIPTPAISIGQAFNIFRKDRRTPGGGVLAYVRDSTPTRRLQHLEVADKEVLWLLHTPSRMPRPFSCIVTAGLYFPPGKLVAEEREMIYHITICLDSVLRERPSAGIVITGDFNQLNTRQLCQRFNLRKVVRTPTRGANILDQLLTNMSRLYSETQHLPPLGRSDHQCILFAPSHRENYSKAITRAVKTLRPENLRALGLKLNQEKWEKCLQCKWCQSQGRSFQRNYWSGTRHLRPHETSAHTPKWQRVDHATHQEPDQSQAESLCSRRKCQIPAFMLQSSKPDFECQA